MAFEAARELNPYFKTPPEWTNAGSGSTLIREGVGIFGQKVSQEVHLDYKSYSVTEIFDGVKRWSHAAPSSRDPDYIFRSYNLTFLLPQYRAAVTVRPPYSSNQILVTAEGYSGDIENVLSGSDVTSPIGFTYNPKRLVGMTLQGEVVSSGEGKYPDYSLEEGLNILLTMAKGESPDRMALYKQDTARLLKAKIDSNFEPEGAEIKAIEHFTNKALASVIDSLPEGEAAANMKLLLDLGLKEKVMDSFVGVVIYDQRKLEALNALTDESVDSELRSIFNSLINTLTIYSRKSSRRYLQIDRIKPHGFRFRDYDVEVGSEVVEEEDLDTQEKRKVFKGVEEKVRKNMGRVEYGQKIPLLDHEFVLDRGAGLAVGCLARGGGKWTVNNIPYKIDAKEIKRLWEDPQTNPEKIKDLLPVEPNFRWSF